jgi:predicted phosphodiesterase
VVTLYVSAAGGSRRPHAVSLGTTKRFSRNEVMNRRVFLQKATVLAGSLGLYGCSNPAEPADRPRRPVEPLKICLHGDTHVGYEGTDVFPPSEVIHSEILRCFTTYKPNIIVNLGDLIHNTAENQWTRFAAMTTDVRSWSKYYPVFGNHDSGDGGPAAFLGFFDGELPNNGGGRLYYWFRHEGVLFVVLDVHENQPADLTAQESWLRGVLAANTDAVFRFVLFHIPPWTTAGRGPFPFARVFDPACREFSVDIVFNGHIHAYEPFKINGIHYVVSGGAGGFGCSEESRRAHCLDTNLDTTALVPLREASAQTNNYIRLEILGLEARLAVFDLSGNQLDSFVIAKENPVGVLT